MCESSATCQFVPAAIGALGLLLTAIVAILVGWVLPIAIGIRAAHRKNFSPHWMWLGIHPALGWAACITLLCVPSRVRCPSCGGFPWEYFCICPYCHAKLERPAGVDTHSV